MSNTVLSKRSGTSGVVPNNLLHGEVAINYADGKMFYKDSVNNIQMLGYNWTVAKATQLSTPRTINGVSFDGTQDITIPSDTTDAIALSIALG